MRLGSAPLSFAAGVAAAVSGPLRRCAPDYQARSSTTDGQRFDQLSVCTVSSVVSVRLLRVHEYAPLPGEYELL